MIKKFSLIVFVLISTLILAGPPTPPGGPGGGVGGTTPGVPASPIDMYVLLLLSVATVFIFLYNKRFKNSLK